MAFLYHGIPAADYRHSQIIEEGAVTGSTIGHALVGELLFTGDTELVSLGSTSVNES